MAQCLTCVMGDRAQVDESFEHRVRGGERHWCGDVLRGAAPVDRLSGAPILDPGNGGAAAYEAGDQKAGSSQRIARKVECRSGDAGECPADPRSLHVNLAGGVFVNPDTRPGWADRWMTAIGHPSFSGCRYTTLAGRLQ